MAWNSTTCLDFANSIMSNYKRWRRPRPWKISCYLPCHQSNEQYCWIWGLHYFQPERWFLSKFLRCEHFTSWQKWADAGLSHGTQVVCFYRRLPLHQQNTWCHIFSVSRYRMFPGDLIYIYNKRFKQFTRPFTVLNVVNKLRFHPKSSSDCPSYHLTYDPRLSHHKSPCSLNHHQLSNYRTAPFIAELHLIQTELYPAEFFSRKLSITAMNATTISVSNPQKEKNCLLAVFGKAYGKWFVLGSFRRT